jgi:predicted Zn-dependent protease
MILLLRLSLVLMLAACAVNPATGRREFSLISESREIEMGREADADISASLGLVDDPALQDYVAAIGHRLAAVSERPHLPWSFKVVDDPLVNAFALPGGFVFVTRGILANFESEAELAGVLGHEIGHVTAKHSVSQMSRQQLQEIGLGVGMIFSSDVRRFGDVLGAGLQLLNLRYSRGNESESDALGVRYMTRTAYDSGSMVGVFRMLAAVSGGQGERIPEWQLTHPYPENREADIRELIAASGSGAGGTVRRDEYLERLAGLVYGPNPREGYFIGDRFVHPDFAFELTFPEGWTAANERSYVAAQSSAGDAAVILRVAEGATDPGRALRALLSQEGISGDAVHSDEGDGLSISRANFETDSDDGASIRGEAAFIQLDGRVYQVLAFADRLSWRQYSGVAGASVSSFARLTDRPILDVQPWTLQIATLSEDMSFRDFHGRYPSPVSVEGLARLNRRTPDVVLPAGTRVKRVVGAPLPGRSG